jgi:hypothetical protein
MATVADCRDFRRQFDSLEPSGVFASQTADDAPWQLLGVAGRLSSANASDEQRFMRRFEAIATRAGIALLGASRAHAFEAWLHELRHRTPHHFADASGEWFTADRREIPFAQIVPPGADEREWRFLEAVHAADVLRRETAISQGKPERSPGDDPRCFIVEPSGDDRYVIVDGEWLYRDCVTRQQSIVTCSMRGQTTKATSTGGSLEHLAAASTELCDLLETDAVEAQARECERVSLEPAVPLVAHGSPPTETVPPAPAPRDAAVDVLSSRGTRRAFVEPKLLAMSMSVADWAKATADDGQTQVDYNTVQSYMTGRTIRLRINTRTRLAQALRVSPGELPE